MKHLKLKLSILAILCAVSNSWAQLVNPRSVEKIEINDVDVNFWTLFHDGHIFMQRHDSRHILPIKADGKQKHSEEVVKVSNNDYYIDEVVYYRRRAAYQIKYLENMSKKALNIDLDNFLKEEIIPNTEACPKAYARVFVLPTEMMMSGTAERDFPSRLVFEPLSFQYNSQYGLIFKYKNYELPLQSFVQGLNQNNIVFIEYYCKARIS
ncbi:hypothetical protein MRY82_10480 [bacterium]|nr:hypothetical protein [bacterium]